MKKMLVLSLCCLAFLFNLSVWAADIHQPTATITDPEVALNYLQEGNDRFVKNQMLEKKDYTLDRHSLTNGQHPFAVVVCCSDSRVVPEIFFDQHIGDLFVIRVAGNVLGKIEMGSIEYAVDHLHAPLVVVVGHESCGAVTAVIDQIMPGLEHGHTLPTNIEAIAEQIRPSLKAVLNAKNLSTSDKPEEASRLAEAKTAVLEATADANVKKMVEIVNSDPLIQKGKTKVVGAKYLLESGQVVWFK